VRNMARQFAMPTEIIGAETFRAEDGLALSSRNMYLSTEERAEAPALYQGLNFVANEIRGGHLDIFSVEREAMATLGARGWKPDYISVRKRIDLQPPSAGDLAEGTPLVVLAAAKLGTTRLIDNLEKAHRPAAALGRRPGRGHAPGRAGCRQARHHAPDR